MRMDVRLRTTPTPTRVLRASAWRALAFVACAAVALAVSVFQARNANADSNYQDVWNHQSLDGGQQYIVGAWNIYDAAAFVCGYSYSTVSGWDLPTLAKLSNAPAIVSLAESFGNVTPWNDERLYDTCEGYFGSDLWNRMQSTYGGFGGIHYNPSGVNAVQLRYWQDNLPAGLHVYALNTTSEMVGAAKEAFRSILAGEDTGGGGTGEMVATFDLYGNADFYNNSNASYTYSTESGTSWNGARNYLSFVWSFSISDAVMSRIDAYKADYPYVYAYASHTTGYWRAGRDVVMYIVMSTGEPFFDTSVNRFNHNGDVIVFKTSHLYTNTTTSSSFTSTSYEQSIGGSRNYWYKPLNYGGSGEPTPDPPNNWPDDGNNTTVAPSPPELPTPHDPTIPTEPDPDPPTYYTPPTPDPPSPDPPYEPIEPTGTSPTDYTPWLRAILLALGGISSDLATHCQHLQAQMKAQATRIIAGINNQLVNLGTSINGAIGDWAKWLGECLGEGFDTLMDNLYDLFHWLAEQFDFTFSGDPYDDSGIIGWLRRIYNRIGSGDPKHYAPTILDPGSEGEEEPFDFWVWLLERIASIFGGVLGGVTDAVTTLLDGIKGKFPFSMPWDVMAILGLLSGNRATPVFTFTIPAIQGWWDAVSIRVDMTPYDSAAAQCRSMVLIWWALVLAMKSTWMINDVLGNVSAGIVGRFTGRLVGTAS